MKRHDAEQDGYQPGHGEELKTYIIISLFFLGVSRCNARAIFLVKNKTECISERLLNFVRKTLFLRKRREGCMKQRTLLEIENKICKNSTIRKMQTIFGNGNIFVKSPKTRTFFKFENKFWILEHF